MPMVIISLMIEQVDGWNEKLFFSSRYSCHHLQDPSSFVPAMGKFRPGRSVRRQIIYPDNDRETPRPLRIAPRTKMCFLFSTSSL